MGKVLTVITFFLTVILLLFAIKHARNVTNQSKQNIQTIQELTLDETEPTQYNMGVPLSSEEQFFLRLVCRDTIFTADLLFSIMSIESKFNKNAYNPPSIGIMQIHETYYQFYIDCNTQRYADFNVSTEKKDWYDFKCNAITGINALEYWQAQTQSTNYRVILAHYNGGWTPNYNYADKVIKEMLGI